MPSLDSISNVSPSMTLVIVTSSSCGMPRTVRVEASEDLGVGMGPAVGVGVSLRMGLCVGIRLAAVVDVGDSVGTLDGVGARVAVAA